MSFHILAMTRRPLFVGMSQCMESSTSDLAFFFAWIVTIAVINAFHWHSERIRSGQTAP